ncbi:MAG TPA: hypothetical protein VNP73_06260, partial [Actinomycetota bacterium]|nr:hypothetical protein [Actinomycetota bacterium]
KNISSYDISDPTAPVLLAQLPVGFMFENEEVAIDPQGKFILFSESLPNDILHVYDVEDPTSITEVGGGVAGAGDHTTSCILECDYAYGSDGSITDLTDYKNPKPIALDTDEDNWHNRVGLIGGGHHVREVRNGLIVSSNLDETPWVIDVKDPEKPNLVAVGDGPKGWSGERGYLWHSAQWPNEANDRWLLMGGEDVLNPPKSSTCNEQQGPFSTFDTTNWEKTHKVTQVDVHRVDNGVYADGNPPANAFGCTGHWFEEHESFNNGGLVTMAWYDHGARFLQITSAGKIKEVGHFLPYAGESSATYWVTDKIVYSADYSRGIDILQWNGPTFVPTGGGGGGGTGGGDGGGGGGGSQLPGPGVKLRISDRNPDRGDTIGFRVALRRCKGHKGTTVRLQRKLKGDFRTIASKPLRRNCLAKFTDVASYRRASYKAIWPKQDDDHRAGRSRPQSVTPQ